MSTPDKPEPVNIERQEGFCDYIGRRLDHVVGFPESVKGLLDSHRRALADLAAARERIAVLEEALRPFVLWAEYQTAPHASFTIPDPIGDGLAITKEEIDVARRALNPEETK